MELYKEHIHICLFHVKGKYVSKAMSVHNVLYTEYFSIYCCILFFFSFLFTSCVLKDQMNFSKNLFFRILSHSPEPIDQFQPNLALSAAPVGDGLPSFFIEGIYAMLF